MKLSLLILITSMGILFSQEPDLNKLLNLTGVSKVEVEVGGLKVVHSDGIKRISTDKLPNEIVEYYKLNSPEAKKSQELASQKEADRIKQIELEKTYKLKHFVIIRYIDNGIIVNEISVRMVHIKAHKESTGEIANGTVFIKEQNYKSKTHGGRFFIPTSSILPKMIDRDSFTAIVADNGIGQDYGDTIKSYKVIRYISKFDFKTAQLSTK